MQIPQFVSNIFLNIANCLKYMFVNFIHLTLKQEIFMCASDTVTNLFLICVWILLHLYGSEIGVLF